MELTRVAGTGAEGAVTLEDVEHAAVPMPAPAPGAPADRTAAMRRAIAAAMSRSKREIPHYYLAEAVPMRKALDWLRAANEQRPVTARLLPAVLLLKAVALAVRDFPEMNGLYVDELPPQRGRAHRRGDLVAPRRADRAGAARRRARGLDELMRGLADLVKRCRAGSLRSSEMSDPTITVTNLGDQGVEAVYGVIYPPQVALVGFGRTSERPWIEDGRVMAMPALTASLSADHRASDGHRGALFLARLRDLLQQPESL